MQHDSFNYAFPNFSPKEGVFSKHQLIEIFYALKGRKEIPLKYAYFENGVDHWDKKTKIGIESIILADDAKPTKFNMFAFQYQLIQQNLEMVLSSFKNCEKVNVIDVGCGNGWPVYPILSYLQENDQLNNYIALDLVEKMTNLAIKNLKSREDLQDLKTFSCVHDFEEGHFADKIYPFAQPFQANLFCFFGNTLGTVVDRVRALANIRDSMNEGDLLWISNSLYENASPLVDFYNSMNTINKEDLLTYHQGMLTLLESFGLKWVDFGSIKVEHADKKGLLDYFFVVQKGFVLNFPIDGEVQKIEFHPGDRIKYCKLKNYKEADFIDELSQTGFRTKCLSISDNGIAGLILVGLKSA